LSTIASSPQPPLSGQVAAVTGAGRGIGRAIAMKLAELGAHTILCGRSRPSLEETAAAIEQNSSQKSAAMSTAESGGKNADQKTNRSTVIECDVTDLASVEALAAQVERTFERLDILVNNAGIGGFSGPLHRLAPEKWTHHQHLFSGRQKRPAQRGRLRRLKVGIEWLDLFRSRGVALPQHSRLRRLPRLNPHRIQPAYRHEHGEDATSRRRGPRGSHAGNPSPAILR
jgi:hypothetical protein